MKQNTKLNLTLGAFAALLIAMVVLMHAALP